MNNIIIREPEVLKICGISKATRWRLEKAGKFPARKQLSTRAVGWALNEIEEWKENLESISEVSV